MAAGDSLATFSPSCSKIAKTGQFLLRLSILGQSALGNEEVVSALSERLKITEDRELAHLIAMTLARID